MSKEVRIGMVGCGHISGRHAQRWLKEVPNAKVVAGADPNLELAKTVMGEIGAQAFETDTEMLDAVELDALYVCSPPFARGTVEYAAAKRGIHLFLEKPIAPSLEAARMIWSLIQKGQEEAGRKIMVSVAYNWRYHPHVEYVRKQIARQSPHAFIATWKEALPPAEWWRKVETSGGPVIEQASHLLDLGMYFCGRIVKVQAMARAFRPKDFGNIDDLCLANFEFENGCVGQLVHTCLLNQARHRIGWDLLTTGTEFCGDRHGELEIRTRQGIKRLPGGYDLSYIAESDAFIKAILSGDESHILCSFQDGMESLALGEAIRRASASGATEELELVE